MTINAIAQATTIIETATAYGARVYMMASEVFTISAILWCLNFMSNMVQKTYTAGRAVGAFYFAYLHQHVITNSKRLIALLLTLANYAYQGAQYVYTHRSEILAKANDYRNLIGEQFIYVSPSRLHAPKRIKAQRIANTLRFA
jgi:hypothetical protein